jgi:hypothetical protein
MLLVLLPVTGLLAFTAFSAVAQWEEAHDLRTFHRATEVSFALTGVSDAAARERSAAVRARLRPAEGTSAERSAAEEATGRALRQAVDRASSWSGSDIAGVLDGVGRRLHALRVQTGTASLDARTVAQDYAGIEDLLLDHVATL